MRVVKHDVQQFPVALVVLYIDSRLSAGELHSLPALEKRP